MSESREDGNNGHLYEDADEISNPTTSSTESQNENEEESVQQNSSPAKQSQTKISHKKPHHSQNMSATESQSHHPNHSETLPKRNNKSINSSSSVDKENANSNDGSKTASATLKLSSKESKKNNDFENEVKNGGLARTKSRHNGIVTDDSQNYSNIDSSISTSGVAYAGETSSTRTTKKSTTAVSVLREESQERSKSKNDLGSNGQKQNVKGSANKNNLTKDKNVHNTPDENSNSNSPSPTENVPKLSPSIKGRNKSGTSSNSKIGNRLSVTVPGSPFESGVNTECIQLLRQLWNVHEEAVLFLDRIRTALSYFRQESRFQENQFESSLREKRLSTTGLGNSRQGSFKTKFGGVNVNTEILGGLISGEVRGISGNNDANDRVEGWIPLQTFIDGLKCISDSFSDIEKQFLTLSVFQNQCKLVLLAKVKHAKHQVTHDRLSIMHGIQQLINVTLHLLSTPHFWSQTEEEKTVKLVQNVFHLTEVYNWCLESSWAMPTEATSTGSLNSLELLSKEQQPKEASISPSAKDKSKASANSVRVLVQINAANKNDSPLLLLSLKPLSGTRLLQILAQKRSIYASHSFSRTMLSTFYSNSSAIFTLEMFEPSFTDEDSRLNPVCKGFSQYPSLLGRGAVKKTENGDQRLSRSTRTKMYSYFHEVLWTLAGEHAEDLLLWGSHSNVVPLVLQPLDTFIALRNALVLGQHFQESNLSPMLSAFDSVAGALHSFSLLANWDEKMREAFEETYRVKRPEHVALVRKPEPTQWATEIGSKFGHIVTSCLSMIDSGGSAVTNLSNIMRSTAMRLSNEEEPLGNEAQTFFRLEATLVYFKAWVVKRSKVWLNSWAIPQFLGCSQRESALLVKLIKSRETLLITRDFLLNHEDVSIKLSAKHRKACADDLRAALQQVQSMPDEMLLAVGPVCKTLSLATLQSYMPDSNHWKSAGRGSGLGPEKPSHYVTVFINRVIEPVMTAAVELVPGPVQEAMGKQVVHAACDAWLQYVLHKKIRFSEWGAVQLLRDFTAFREWIRTETKLDNEARKAILQLEVLKTCEGVSYLLLRNPGDVLGVGKSNRKNRRVAPLAGSVESSVSPSGTGTDSPAEDDIPAEMYVPNQQMWLELRLRRGVFMPPCCQINHC